MAQVDWTEPALSQMGAIADYIALDNPDAAKRLVQRLFLAAEQLERFPSSGSRIPELSASSPYRQLVVRPCRIIYRPNGNRVMIVHILRHERLLRSEFLA
jgi:toxin ParE1/3/4